MGLIAAAVSCARPQKRLRIRNTLDQYEISVSVLGLGYWADCSDPRQRLGHKILVGTHHNTYEYQILCARLCLPRCCQNN